MGKNRKKRQNVLNSPKSITDKIPYERVFEEEGVFEINPGEYSKAYFIKSMDTADTASINNELIVKKFNILLNEIPSNMTCQFVIHNRLIAEEAFLKKVLVVPNKSDVINDWIDKYNKTIVDNCNIGHNNVNKNKYFVLTVKADLPEEAINNFRLVDDKIKKLFADVCGTEIGIMSAAARLKILYSMYNPKLNDFGVKADLRGNGEFSLQDMKKLRLTTKDCVAPASSDYSNKNYIVLNGDSYVRVFFISCLPAAISSNLIYDITNISSSMIFSATYEKVDAKYGLAESSKLVSDNTLVKQSFKRDTRKDKKNKTIQNITTMIKEDETAFFNNSALNTLKECVAMSEDAILATFTIALYADDLETLNRDTKLLNISTSKFACQVKPLDLQQLQGFQTTLPLGNNKLDCRMLFPTAKLATIPPLNIQEVLQKDGLFNGLNTINDNLVLLNRRNNPTLSGIIAGSEHSGKTFQCKREIFNSLIFTDPDAKNDDDVIVIASDDSYDDFARSLGGEVCTEFYFNPFEIINLYGLKLNPDKYSKSLVLEAIAEIVTRGSDIGQSMDTSISSLIADEMDDKKERLDNIEREVETFLKAEIDFNSHEAVRKYIRSNSSQYEALSTVLDATEKYLNRVAPVDNRLTVYKVTDTLSKVLLMDKIFIRCIKNKMQNKSTCVFIDNIDDLLSSEQTTTFLLDYVTKMNTLRCILTMVVQSSVKLFTDNTTTFRLEDLVNTCGYFKLLNQGAIERKKYTELLNISNSLVNYITSAELGKGIILTSASNLAFDDSFYDDEDDKIGFYDLFKK